MLSSYYPTKTILGANVDNTEKMTILTSFRECLLNACKNSKKKTKCFKETVKDKLLKQLIFEDHSPLETSTKNGTITDNIVYYMCGYMIFKYRKMACKQCLETINLDLELLPEVITKEKLTLMKTKGKLKLASNNFFRLVSHVEAILLSFCIIDNIYVKNAFEEILKQISENEIPKVGCSKHAPQFVVNLIYDYLLLRFKAIARKKNQERVEALVTKRHSNRKMSKI